MDIEGNSTFESIADTARRISVTTQCIRNWSNQGDWTRPFKAGRTTRFKKSENLLLAEAHASGLTKSEIRALVEHLHAERAETAQKLREQIAA